MSSSLSILNYKRPTEFRMGDVLARSWGVLTRHLFTFFLLCALARLPMLVVRLGLPLPSGQSRFAWTQGLLTLMHLSLSSFAQAFVVFAACQDLRGRAVNAFQSLTRGLSRLFPVLVLSISTALVIALGFLLLLIPGLIAMAALAVSLPVCVVEKAELRSSMTRSLDLTNGHRWPIVGVAFVVVAVNWVADRLIGLSFGSINSIFGDVIFWLWSIALLSFQSVYTAVLYHNLRAVKEGIGIEEIAAAFD